MTIVKPEHFIKREDVSHLNGVYTYEFKNDSQIVKVSTVNNGLNYTVMFIQIGADNKKYIELYDYCESVLEAIKMVYKRADEIRKKSELMESQKRIPKNKRK